MFFSKKMKRFADDDHGNSDKRVKYNSVADDLWGDSDPDIDEFLIQASQMCEQQIPVREAKINSRAQHHNDQSILSSYSDFNKPNKMVASTQLEIMVDTSIWARPQPLPSTSRSTSVKKQGDNIYEQLKQLKEQLEAKDGEVTILRSQLKQTKEHVEQEKIRRTNETLAKLSIVEKERDKINAELGFKNLEIANLKRKLTNITRNLFDCSGNEQTVDQSRSGFFPNNETTNLTRQDNEDREHVIVSVKGTRYPLKSVISTKIFESNADDRFPQVARPKHTTDERHLHSLLSPNRHGWHKKGIYTYVSYRETLRLKHFFPAIRFLMNASQSELENDRKMINQVFITTHIWLNNQLEHLSTIAQKIQKDEIRECDLVSLYNPNWNVNLNVSLFEPTSCCIDDKEECAIQCRQGVSLLAAVFPYNNYLQQILINNKTIEIIEDEQLSWLYPLPNDFAVGNEINFLGTLLKITILIGQTRKSNVYTGLLSSICYLMSQIIQIDVQNNTSYQLIGNLTKELVLTMPTYPVLYHLSKLFKKGATCKQFVEQLCLMQEHCQIQKKPKKCIMLVNNKCCTFQVYSTLCREAVTSIHCINTGGDFRIHLNLLRFVSNAIGSSVKWLHFIEDNVHFDCQIEYCKLTIDIIYAVLTKFKILQSLKQEISKEITTIIKLSPSILSTLNKRFGELIECNTQYSPIMKSCHSILKELQSDDCREIAAKIIEKQDRCESPPPVALNWDASAQLSLKLS